MRRKINFELLGVAAITIVTTLVMVACVFYGIFKNEILQELKNDTQLLTMEKVIEKEDLKNAPNRDNLRITLIAADGKVEFDNYIDASKMANHSERQEIKEAMEKGEGRAVRKSNTIGKNTYYYAIRQKNNTILRVAKEADNIMIIFKNALPMVLAIGAAIFGLCIILAHFLTKSLVRPIQQFANNIEDSESISAYKELIPFIETIQKQHKDILKSAKMRQEFTANVSHELKTPLTSISGYAELIENGMADGEDVRRFASEIHRNANRLLNLINDIIKLSELDATEIEVNFERVNLYDIAKESVDMLYLSAQNHEVSLTLTGTECYVTGNKSMLEEVTYNLCDNAIRYNNRGGKVQVIVEKGKDKATLIVKDTGIGISKKNQERIFERFYRVDKSRSKSTGGTGLGLAIVKHIVAQHKADLQIQSEVGKGTEIKVSFKLVD